MTRNRIGIVLFAISLIVTILATVKHISRSPVYSKNGTSSIVLPPSVALKVFKIAENCWGYEILIDNKPFIYQEQVPGFPGNVQFKNQADAMSCGSLVLHKIKKHQRPSVSKTELDSLKITY